MSASSSRSANASTHPEFLAAGTDLLERRRSGISAGPVVQILRTEQNTHIAWTADGAAVIGSMVTIADVAQNAHLVAAYPGLAAAATALATPQIRNLGTIGGNLTQRTRCWYYRNPHTACLKKGDDTCPARTGNHLYGVMFDRGPCVAPHPSTLAAALLAYEATITTSARPNLTIAGLIGDGSDGSRDHTLDADEQILSVNLPPPLVNEQSIYRRAIGRSYAEWPLAETVIRVLLESNKIVFARVVAGGVATVPLRLTAVEDALIGSLFNAETVARAASLASMGATPLPLTGYKVPLLNRLIADVLGSLTP